MAGTWTISELAERAVAALAAGDPLNVNGRVRDLPNERLIRWYTTIGLVDPPLGRRGRTAVYGQRHLLQVVAVKRRQAAGRTIAEIQLELAGATDDTLRQIAQIPGEPSDTDAPAPRNRFWATRPAAPDIPSDVTWKADIHHTSDASAPGSSATPPAPIPSGRPAHVGMSASAEPARSGTGEASPPRNASSLPGQGEPLQEPAAPSPSDVAPPHDTAEQPRGRQHPHAKNPASRTSGTASAPDTASSTTRRASVVQGVRLAPGLTVMLDAPALTDDDLVAIADAAGPLLEELRRRGLLAPMDTPIDHSGRPQ